MERVDTATGAQELPSIGEVPTERRDAPGSGHSPVVARIALDEG